MLESFEAGARILLGCSVDLVSRPITPRSKPWALSMDPESEATIYPDTHYIPSQNEGPYF